MIEKELRGVLTEESFLQKLKKFTVELGHPVIQKRLAIKVGSLHKFDLQNRIRITNGVAEIVQKTGERNAMEREEIVFTLPSNVDHIYNAFVILRNTIVDPTFKQSLIMQFDNSLFHTEDYELKFAHQTGKSHKYVFELEAKKEEIDLDQLALKLGLTANMHQMTTEDWAKWDNELNIDVDTLSQKEFKTLIQKYLDFSI